VKDESVGISRKLPGHTIAIRHAGMFLCAVFLKRRDSRNLDSKTELSEGNNAGQLIGTGGTDRRSCPSPTLGASWKRAPKNYPSLPPNSPPSAHGLRLKRRRSPRNGPSTNSSNKYTTGGRGRGRGGGPARDGDRFLSPTTSKPIGNFTMPWPLAFAFTRKSERAREDTRTRRCRVSRRAMDHPNTLLQSPTVPSLSPS